MKKLLITSFVIIICALILPLASESAELPEIESWQNGELRIVTFHTEFGNHGSWQTREYRTELGTPVYVNLLEGSGEKSWSPQGDGIPVNDGLIGRGAVYRAATIASQKGLIEHHPVTGYSIVVKIAKIGTLTVESKYAKEDEILAAADTLVLGIMSNQQN